MLRAGMPHGVHSYSWLPARKSRNRPECMKFHFLPLPSANTSRNSFLVLVRLRKCSWWCALIGIARRHRHADAEFGGIVEELGDILGGVSVKDRGVDVDREPLRL